MTSRPLWMVLGCTLALGACEGAEDTGGSDMGVEAGGVGGESDGVGGAAGMGSEADMGIAGAGGEFGGAGGMGAMLDMGGSGGEAGMGGDTGVGGEAGMGGEGGEAGAGGLPDEPVGSQDCMEVFGISCETFAEGYIKASNSDFADFFGVQVALHGDTLAVSTTYEASSATGVDGDQSDNSAPESGGVYVFTRTADAWRQQAYIKASNTQPEDVFGWSIALEGDTLVVGAPGEDSDAVGIGGDGANNNAPESGAVYVFTRAEGVWSETAFIKASNTHFYDAFGFRVALNGGRLAVSAPGEDSSAAGSNRATTRYSGAVYTFMRSDGEWRQEAFIKASNADEEDGFGSALALEGDTLVVSAVEEESSAAGVNGDQANNSVHRSGAVYVFERGEAEWAQQAYLKASNPEINDAFGSALALEGDTLIVSAPGEDSAATGVNGDALDNGAQDSGAVYVFTRVDGAWSQQAYIKSSNAEEGDRFGQSVALDHGTLVVGADHEGSDAVDLNGHAHNNDAPSSGAVYLFTQVEEVWTQEAYIKASNTDSEDVFGTSLALDAGTFAVGAMGEGSGAAGVDGDQADNSGPLSGAVYVRRVEP